MNWISVKDNLPKLKTWVLILVPNKGIGIAFYYSFVDKEKETEEHKFDPHFNASYGVSQFSGDDRHFAIKREEITHWCNLSDIPLP
jgi:hypothetical protein